MLLNPLSQVLFYSCWLSYSCSSKPESLCKPVKIYLQAFWWHHWFRICNLPLDSHHLDLAIRSKDVFRNTVWDTRIIQFAALCEGGMKFIVIVLYHSERYYWTCPQTGHVTRRVGSHPQTAVVSPLAFDVCLLQSPLSWHCVQHWAGVW